MAISGRVLSAPCNNIPGPTVSRLLVDTCTPSSSGEVSGDVHLWSWWSPGPAGRVMDTPRPESLLPHSHAKARPQTTNFKRQSLLELIGKSQ